MMYRLECCIVVLPLYSISTFLKFLLPLLWHYYRLFTINFLQENFCIKILFCNYCIYFSTLNTLVRKGKDPRGPKSYGSGTLKICYHRRLRYLHVCVQTTRRYCEGLRNPQSRACVMLRTSSTGSTGGCCL
jgi:hypothetical protein